MQSLKLYVQCNTSYVSKIYIAVSTCSNRYYLISTNLIERHIATASHYSSLSP